jgi:phospholipase/carboxylesterase
VSALLTRERPASAEAAGLLVLHHGRGADEHDLLTLGDVLDPDRRLHIVTPRAPFELPGWTGYHWYRVSRVGHPEQETFFEAYRKLSRLHDRLWADTGIPPERTVLGGFSMGAVMSYALGLGADRPAPAGVMAFSGFIPSVEGWRASLGDREHLRAFIAHGRNDRVIDVEFARRAHETLSAAGLDVDYQESDSAHHIDPRQIPLASDWLTSVIAPRALS